MMRGLILLGWVATTAAPGVALLLQERKLPLAFADLVATVCTALLWLLLVAGRLPFFGGAWQDASAWLSLAIALAAVNLGLAFTCLLVLPTPTSSVPVRARFIALVSFWSAVGIGTPAGFGDRYLYGISFRDPLVGLMSGLVILALAGGLVVLLTSGRERRGS